MLAMEYSIIIFISVLLGILKSQPVFSKANLDTLRVSQVIFRHGARNIDETFPTDPYKNESYWNPGYSQLTNNGKLQGYNLGLFLRERYDGFVKTTYDMKDIYVLSSDAARTVQTAYSVMAGFYMPNQILTKENETVEDYLTNNNQVEIPLPWKSVPVHNIPAEHDNIIQQPAYICPRYAQLYLNLPEKNENVKRFYEESSDILEYLSSQSGLDAKIMKNLMLILNALITEQYYNMTLPNWTERLFATDKVKNLYHFFSEFMTYTAEMKRLHSGQLVKRLLQNMIMNKTSLAVFDQSGSGFKKMQFFSAHDSTVAGLLNTLGIFNKKTPPYTAALMIELHQKVDTSLQPEFFVEIYYRNETDREPYHMKLPNCGFQCPLVDFERLVTPYIPLNWNQECQVLSEPGSISLVWIVFIVLLVCVAIFVIFQFWMGSSCSCFSFICEKEPHNGYSNMA